MTRLFVAVVPPAEVVEHLEEHLAPRRDAASFRWTDPGQWHLTLAFAADAADRDLDAVDEEVGRCVARRGPFRLALAGGGAFPDPDRARVLVTRVDAGGQDLDALSSLSAGCRAALTRAGARVDGQRFRPHLTVGRLGRPANVTSWVRLLDAYRGPEWVVGEVALVASHLGEGPRGRPRHEVLGTYALGPGRG